MKQSENGSTKVDFSKPTELSRKELRAMTVELINSLSRKELLERFAISRVNDLTGLDTIGLPVTSAVRALSRTVSIHTGKGLELSAARAGAILEAIEFETTEHPVGPFRIASQSQLPEEERLELVDCFPARSSVVNEFTPLAWEEATNIQTGEKKLVPSDLIWMRTRIQQQPLMYLQMSSNGVASGGSLEDAILSALYEVLERDAWTLNQFLLDNCGIMPARTPLAGLPPRLETILRQIERAQAKLHLLDITNDYKVPCFGAIILDLSPVTAGCAGTFGGYGCHLNAEIAAVRAVTEAAQARCCYISGTRDDMFRRQFLLMKRMDQPQLDRMFNELELGSPLSEYRQVSFPDVRSELRYLLKLIKARGVNEVYVKELGSFLDKRVHVVRVFSPQCEAFKSDQWTPSLRCLSYAERKVMSLAKPPEAVAEEELEEEGESWKQV